jgi:preprotein translocase subunit Sec63
MARQYMTKDVTITTIQSGKIIINKEGKPEVSPMKDITIIGTISNAKAIKMVFKKYGNGTTIYNTIEEQKTYRMKVEDFIKVAELVTDDTPKEDLDFDSEDEDDNEDSDSNDESEEDRTPPQPKQGKAKIKIIPKEPVES